MEGSRQREIELASQVGENGRGPTGLLAEGESRPDESAGKTEVASKQRSDGGDRSNGKEGRSSLKALPMAQRPRERLLKTGGAGLTDAELLAVLLRTGRPGQSAIEMAAELLEEHGGLGGMLWTDSRRLCRSGLQNAKASTVLAAVELARRLTRSSMSTKELLDRPGAVASYLLLRYGRIDQEVMGAVYLDRHHRLLAEGEIFRGTLTRAAVEPRAVLREALLHGAAGMILFHTHPSGDPSPSPEDVAFTHRMARACEAVGVELVDHLVVGGFGRWESLKERVAW